MNCRILSVALVVLMSVVGLSLPAAELVELNEDTWDDFAPQGKEVDCIYGDYVLRNDKIVVVIAQPLATRNANMTVRGVGAGIIDLTERGRQNDQLSAFYPGASRISFNPPARSTVRFESANSGGAMSLSRGLKLNRLIKGEKISVEIVARPQADRPSATLRYSIKDGEPFVLVETVYKNDSDKAITEPLVDSMRADRTFAFGTAAKPNLFWASDDWFRQTYGFVGDGCDVRRAEGGGVRVEYVKDGKASVTLAAGESFTLSRRLFVGGSLLEVLGKASDSAGTEVKTVRVRVEDAAGAVSNAKVPLRAGDAEYASGRTDSDGKLVFDLPGGQFIAAVEALGRPAEELKIDVGEAVNYEIKVQSCGYVAASITDEKRGPIPCKVEFRGKDGTADPYFGPDSEEVVAHNLHYSHTGKFRQEIGPGKYDVIISHGPEYDAIFTEIEVERGKEAKLTGKLVRTVDTTGWVSSDFHSHSSPSGDNTSSQLGRVLNLLCEHIEFAPCTEHNRLSTYTPHLKHLGVEHLMATCVGIELTGSDGSVNHQNAFPLVQKPRTQDGGGPVTDANPIVQIERLALWDAGSDKLVQTNHPTIPKILGDRDGDTKPDGGFEKMFGFMDVIEVHPPTSIFSKPESLADAYKNRNAIFHWMQMLNLGYRVPGVVNTDAHYNYHGSGWLRNWLKSPTDDPAKVETMDMVHTAEAGHIIMSNGPFMDVKLTAEDGGEKSTGIPGDDVQAPDGKANLAVRVQCPNWLDVNRVQVFLNGQPTKDLNFTRRTTPDKFGNEVVKFEGTIPLQLKTDTHVIVAAAGEGLKLGPVMGPQWGNQMPVVVSNPIFVDVDGGGFKPNGDLLGVPLPVKDETKE